MEGSRADFRVVRLMDHTTFIGPKALERQNEILEKHQSLPAKK